MGKEILMFGDIEIVKDELYRHKSPVFLKDVINAKDKILYWH